MKAKTKLGMGMAAKTKRKKSKRKVTTSTRKRTLPVAKRGGFLPLLPLLGALGSLAGGAAGIVKAVNDRKAARRQLEELQRHDRAMEGRGLYIAPYKRGSGAYTARRRGRRRGRTKKNFVETNARDSPVRRRNDERTVESRGDTLARALLQRRVYARRASIASAS
ncbi:hypothetical protein ACS0PU_002266 [Formica fusca]